MVDQTGLRDGIVFHYDPVARSICKALEQEAQKIGITPPPVINWASAELAIVKDALNGSDCLSATWRDAHGTRKGLLQFNSDGSFFAEYDVVQPHPKDKRWFVEAVTAWGRDNRIATEPRLLAMPE